MNGLENLNHLHFPVVGLEFKDGKYEIKEIYGTAFAINNDFFVTAGHVITNAQECEKYGMAYLIDGKTKFSIGLIKEAELDKNNDIGIFKIRIPYAKCLKWNLGDYPILADVCTTGFPYGLNRLEKGILARSYKGYIVTLKPFYRQLNHAQCYELSFSCPRGLSGAALLSRGASNSIRGVIIGNEQSQMEVYREKEESKTENTKETVIQTLIQSEYLTHGIALHSTEIVQNNYSILGMSLLQYLSDNQMIAEDH